MKERTNDLIWGGSIVCPDGAFAWDDHWRRPKKNSTLRCPSSCVQTAIMRINLIIFSKDKKFSQFYLNSENEVGIPVRKISYI